MPYEALQNAKTPAKKAVNSLFKAISALYTSQCAINSQLSAGITYNKVSEIKHVQKFKRS